MYISLHNHSHYSTLDGYQTVPEMVTRAKELGYTALSLTDHGTMRGIVDFYEECNRQEIKPILGCEFYFCETPEIKDRALTHHLVLLAMDDTGYHNLKLLDSEAYKEENYFFTMRLGLDELRRHSEGIICLTACMAGVLNTNRADWWMQELHGIFGDRLYAEIQPLNIPEQQEYNRKVIELARKYNVPLVVTTDAHYATPADQPYHTLWNEIRGFSYHDNENYLWSEQEIRDTAWIPEEVKDEAIKNTEYIASLCNATITMGGNHYPSYPTDNPSEEIRNICRKAWKDKVPKGRYKEYGERFNAEMVDLEKAGYLNYLLVIWDMLRWCMENNIPTGVGRGSCSGSLVGYLLGIHEIDPLVHGTEFFRFCNPFRITPCDIDSDVSTVGRGRIIDYVKQKYGNICKVMTIGYTKNPEKNDVGKASIQRAGKALKLEAQALRSLVKRVTGSLEEILECPEFDKATLERLYDVAKHFCYRLDKTGCLAPHELVNTSTGMRMIKDIKVGDYVLTEDGSYRKVYNVIPTISSTENIIRFKTISNKSGIDFTANHVMKVIDRKVIDGVANTRGRMYTDLDSEYKSYEIEARDVDINKHMFYIPLEKNNCDYKVIHHGISGYNCSIKIKDDIVVDEDMAWLLGAFIAEGSTSKYGHAVIFTYNDDESGFINKTLRIMKEKFGIDGKLRHSNHGHSIDVTYSSKMLATWIKRNIGHGCYNVNIPQYICDSNDSVKLSFIRGIYDGEGQKTQRKNGGQRCQIEMHNRQVISWIYNTLLRMGLRCSYREQPRKSGTISWILGLSNNACFAIYGEPLTSKDTYKYQMAIVTIDGRKCMAFKITEKDEFRNIYHTVYDISVEGNHTFACNGFIVHNCHASAILVTPDAIENYTPLEGMYSNDTSTGERTYIRAAAYTFHQLEAMGCMKLDILGLSTLDIINDCLKNIGKTRADIPMNDKKTFDTYAQGNLDGVFQMESSGMQRVAKELHVSNFNDVAALVALFRPGPIDSGMLQQYIDAKNGAEVHYTCDAMKKIAGNTFNVLVYQEQIMKIAMEMAGYNLGQADALRKIIGRKEVMKINQAVKEFVEACVANGYEESVAQSVGEQIRAAGNYCFNKAHACSYALLSYMTAYLKTHYPVEYMCAVINSKGKQEDIIKYLPELKRLNIEILEPSYKVGNMEWQVEGRNIRMGLGYIKGVGKNIVLGCKSWKEFVDKNTKTVGMALIKAGAMDSIGKSRAWMIANFEDDSKKLQRVRQCDERIEHYSQLGDTKRVEQWQQKKSEVQLSINAEKEYDEAKGEMEVLGMSFHKLPKILVGIADSVQEFHDKKGNTMARIVFKTDYGEFKGVVFASKWKKKTAWERGRGNVPGITVEQGKKYEFIIDNGVIMDAKCC
ncbi:PHP domain-containing protein [Veillonellaceae bacterium WCA-693-APC-5D-A]|uniref:PHP domain-containing protein n=1 Tax=Anaerovibrio slackiae TaxID=2652309 RepID=A0A6I2UF00_9FIRM|nr:PHP domain-containing protein [Anaerovibrio slackiae]MSU08249.1 PHP domain-containing protein [Anaerovibrio slackiae]